jgi:NADPH-dependent 2,4-dienoyl-CoA reductase/sulfur reductase-like enzyme
MTTSNGHDRDGIVIAGGGLAGQRCTEALRRAGYEGPIRFVCGEPHRPYDRPPLSKQLLTGTQHDQTLPYRPNVWYEKQGVDLMLGQRACALRVREKTVVLGGGRQLHYSRLLVATGGRPRRLPLLEPYSNVSTLRSLDDALALRSALGTSQHLVVLGAGFLGLEVAATARQLGLQVTIIEAGPAALASVLGPRLGSWFERLHRDHGVRLLMGRTVERVHGNGSVRELVLSGGELVSCDRVVVAVGIDPEVSWLHGSGLDGRHGVEVDRQGQSQVPDVFAAGDAAATLDQSSGRYVAGSHWEAAARQAACSARVMLGLDPGPMPLAGFWTDQYGLRIHYLGDRRCADAVRIDGDPDSRRFTATFTHAGRVVAALLVNQPRLLPQLRCLIEKGQ